MKILFFTDIHCNTNYWGREDIRESELKRTFSFILHTTINYKPDIIIIGGDVFDSKVSLDFTYLMRTWNFFNKLIQYAPIYIISGNHDFIDSSGAKYNALNLLSVYNKNNKTHIISNDFYILEMKEISSLLCFIPFIRDREKLKFVFEKIAEKFNTEFSHIKTKICFGHFNIKETLYNNREDDSISISEMFLDSYDKIYMGHIHKRFSFNNKISFVGSVNNLSFLDKNDIKKGALLLELSASGIHETYINNPYCSIFLNEKVDNITNKFKEFYFDPQRNYFLQVEIPVKDRNYENALLDNPLLQKFYFVKKKYLIDDSNSEIEVSKEDFLNSVFSSISLSNNSTEIESFLDVFDKYINYSKKYNFNDFELKITHKLYITQENK